jgi:hypothetical protein
MKRSGERVTKVGSSPLVSVHMGSQKLEKLYWGRTATLTILIASSLAVVHAHHGHTTAAEALLVTGGALMESFGDGAALMIAEVALLDLWQEVPLML